ncbi:MAG: hypothetical protein HUU50_13760 [Candidatus Brocadiae bacterium]|nr:hypothetical protein [Candidatus Brocadiia bacterium]
MIQRFHIVTLWILLIYTIAINAQDKLKLQMLLNKSYNSLTRDKLGYAFGYFIGIGATEDIACNQAQKNMIDKILKQKISKDAPSLIFQNFRKDIINRAEEFILEKEAIQKYWQPPNIWSYSFYFKADENKIREELFKKKDFLEILKNKKILILQEKKPSLEIINAKICELFLRKKIFRIIKHNSKKQQLENLKKILGKNEIADNLDLTIENDTEFALLLKDVNMFPTLVISELYNLITGELIAKISTEVSKNEIQIGEKIGEEIFESILFNMSQCFIEEKNRLFFWKCGQAKEIKKVLKDLNFQIISYKEIPNLLIIEVLYKGKENFTILADNILKLLEEKVSLKLYIRLQAGNDIIFCKEF